MAKKKSGDSKEREQKTFAVGDKVWIVTNQYRIKGMSKEDSAWQIERLTVIKFEDVLWVGKNEQAFYGLTLEAVQDRVFHSKEEALIAAIALNDRLINGVVDLIERLQKMLPRYKENSRG